uniref:Cycloeucalenol cycloisomerase n=1 Tax=Aegilops tauschii subsp. strangulata TaxID=200361 RepID=A0A453PUP9_AEGTS
MAGEPAPAAPNGVLPRVSPPNRRSRLPLQLSGGRRRRSGAEVARPERAHGWRLTGARGGGRSSSCYTRPSGSRSASVSSSPSSSTRSFTELEYLVLGLVSTVPAFVIPLLFVGKADSIRSLKDRYWVKANVWIIIFSYVGNYFWTHYFFTVLGASYTFPSWRMNNVPHTTFLLTHACFLFYHMASNMTLRRLRHSTAHLPQSIRWLFEAAWILALSYFIAYLETLAIANFPYYEFVDRDIMYKVGSLFYAIYFLVSFPMFSRIDEKAEKWALSRV